MNCVSSGACLEARDANDVRDRYGSASTQGAWVSGPWDTITAPTTHPQTPLIDFSGPDIPDLDSVDDNFLIDYFADWSNCELALASVGFASLVKATVPVAITVNKAMGPGAAVVAAVSVHTMASMGGAFVSAETGRRSAESGNTIGKVWGKISMVAAPIPKVNEATAMLEAIGYCGAAGYRWVRDLLERDE